ncbi:MAG: chitobiase/beta-hexosaminidase C-terminal domain-containing protein [Bacteroidia bacterium]|nr:chitobiase/beta-hexosaminidase C-terminal domain-containing protein [Bacteroidia bacterium]
MNKYLFTACWLVAALTSVAQSPLDHPKHMYQDSLKRLYTHPDLPQYIFLSTDPTGKNAYRMESETNKTITNPMRWDGAGIHTFKHQDLIEKTVIVFEIYADGTAPATAADFGQTPTYKAGDIRYYGGGLQVSLSARDDMSGVEAIYYSLDGAAYTPYTRALTFPQEKTYVLKYYAVDHVGNAEPVREATFAIDLGMPSTTLRVEGDFFEEVLSPRATLVLTSTEGRAGVRQITWQLDDQPEKPYLTPISLTNLAQGQHTLTYYATDQVNNREAAKTFTFFLDNVPPIVSDDVIGDRYVVNGKEYASGRTKVRLTALDNKSGVEAIYYRLNADPFQKYEAPFYLPSRAGATSVFAYAVDKAQNSSLRDNEGKSIRTFSVDLSGPTLSYELTGAQFKTRDTIFIGPATQVKLVGTDAESGLNRITYQVNKGAEQPYAAPITLKNAGIYLVDFFGYDNVENRNVSSLTIRVDDKGPEGFPRLSIESISEKTVGTAKVKVYPAHVVLFFSATDDLSGYDKLFYTINGGEEKLYVNPIGNFERGKDYVIKYRALDKLGNETRAELTFSTEK